MYNTCTVPVCTKRNSAVISLGLKLPLNKTHLNLRAWRENKNRAMTMTRMQKTMVPVPEHTRRNWYNVKV